MPILVKFPLVFPMLLVPVGNCQPDSRDHLRLAWWASWVSLRSCPRGTETAVNRELGTRPAHSMRQGHTSYGHDGTKGA